jgi:hypothetical protein
VASQGRLVRVASTRPAWVCPPLRARTSTTLVGEEEFQHDRRFWRGSTDVADWRGKMLSDVNGQKTASCKMCTSMSRPTCRSSQGLRGISPILVCIGSDRLATRVIVVTVARITALGCIDGTQQDPTAALRFPEVPSAALCSTTMRCFLTQITWSPPAPGYVRNVEADDSSPFTSTGLSGNEALAWLAIEIRTPEFKCSRPWLSSVGTPAFRRP